MHLKPLVKHFDVLENTDFKDVQSLLQPLVHCVALVWANSGYYCTSNKIITLIREIANLLIQEVCHEFSYTLQIMYRLNFQGLMT